MNPDDLSSLDATLDMMAALDTIITTVVAYRDRMVEAGFSPDVSERMAEEFHRLMLKKGAG
jgi:hypothetical protein